MLNQPLGGLRVIEGSPLYEDRTEGMGAVAAYTYGEHTVVFVGTRSGQLKKVRPQRDGWMWREGGPFYVTDGRRWMESEGRVTSEEPEVC